MMWQFIAVGLGLAGGFYMSRHGWTRALNVLAVFSLASPLVIAFLTYRSARVQTFFFGIALLFGVGRLLLIHPTPTLVAGGCATVALVAFVAFTLNRQRLARGLVLLLGVVLVAVQTNRVLGPWVELG